MIKQMIHVCAAMLAALLVVALPGAAGAEIKKETHVYKTVGALPIKADVYRSDDDAVRPVVVWIHGGALIMGNREAVPQRLKKAFLDAGYIFVSIDYRLAPETKLPEIIADLEDALAWVRRKGPELFHADPERLAVFGGSAGGYLTLTAGFRAKPRPTVLVALWGYGDLVGPWLCEPSPHPRHNKKKIARDEAYRQVAGPPIADSRDRQGDGAEFYYYCRQNGVWPKAVSGWDVKTEAEKFAPYMAVHNVTADYPPILLIHGDRDTDVPYEQSEMMTAELKRHGVEHKLIRVSGGEHGLQGADPKAIDDAYAAAEAFIREHLDKK